MDAHLRPSTPNSEVSPHHASIPYSEALRVWIRVALLSFGGPAGQIAVMHHILVEEKKWVSEERFLHALNYCMLLPGPEAQQLATYIGWLLHRTRGGLTAGILFILPGFVSILALSILYALYQESAWVEALFFGLKAAVLAVVVEAVFRIGRRALKNRVMMGIAAAAFIAIFFLEIPFPLIIVSAGAIGMMGGWRWPSVFARANTNADSSKNPAGADDAVALGADHPKPTWRRSVRVAAVCLALWFTPIAGLAMYLGPSHVLTVESAFFSKVAVVTFGGAYAVLAYVAQQAVETHQWLLAGEMLDGLGMAETTPGPLIQVMQYVGFMGAFRHPEPFSPLMAGLLGAVITTWVTFVPCFLWIFLGAPYVERLRGNQHLDAILTTITAAVVGVILNLAIWFALHVAFAELNELRYSGVRLLLPNAASADWASILIAFGAFMALFQMRWGMIQTLGVSAAVGMVYHLLLRG